jgi:hypothetical protein
LTNTFDDESGQGGAFLQLPPDMTIDEFIDLVGPGESSSVAGGQNMWPPDWYNESMIAGGPYAYNGQTTYAVVELTEGEWAFWAEYPGVPQVPVPINVTGEMAADAPVPEADITIEMSEYAFAFSDDLTPGTQVIELVNVGEQPHFMIVAQLPDGTTEHELTGLLAADILDVFGTGDQSAGTTAWYVLTVESGTFVSVCVVTDPESGQPHNMLGMVEVFDIED